MNEAAPNGPGRGEFSGRDAATSLRTLARPGVAWVVLGLCLLVTAIAWRVAMLQLRQRDYERFRRHMERVNLAIENRVDGCEQLLKGAAGLFAASQSVERREWREFVRALGREDHHGIRALGFIEDVAATRAASFVASNRLDGAPEFSIHSTDKDSSRSNYYVVKFVEPSQRNSTVLGYDIASDQRRRQAAELARDTGNAVLTSRIKLIQGDEDQPAVLLLLPVYRPGAGKETVEQRRAAIVGWVYAAIIVRELMSGLLEGRDPEIDFEVFDGTIDRKSVV